MQTRSRTEPHSFMKAPPVTRTCDARAKVTPGIAVPSAQCSANVFELSAPGISTSCSIQTLSEGSAIIKQTALRATLLLLVCARGKLLIQKKCDLLRSSTASSRTNADTGGISRTAPPERELRLRRAVIA